MACEKDELERPKSYKVVTIDDMLKLPVERLDDFLADLKIHLLSAHAQGAIAEAFAGAVHPNLRLSIRSGGMIWTDDGKHDIGASHMEGKNVLSRPVPEADVNRVIGGLHRLADRLRERTAAEGAGRIQETGAKSGGGECE